MLRLNRHTPVVANPNEALPGPNNGILLTPSDEINRSSPSALSPPKATYVNSLTLQLIGKSSVVFTQKSALIRCYVTNKTDDYRLTIWKDQFDRALESLKINNIIHMTNVRFIPMYAYKADEKKEKLYKGGEFVATDRSVFTVRALGKLEEFPAVNDYPPFWRNFVDIKLGDTEIATRALLISEISATDLKFPVDEYGDLIDTVGIKFGLSDVKGNKATCFVECDLEEPIEKEMIEELKKGLEIVLVGARLVKDGANVGLFIVSPEYIKVMPVEVKKIQPQSSYKPVVFPILATSNATDPKKPRLSSFF